VEGGNAGCSVNETLRFTSRNAIAALTQQSAYCLGGDVVVSDFLVAQLGHRVIPLHP
jgi:hypothetical protein